MKHWGQIKDYNLSNITRVLYYFIRRQIRLDRVIGDLAPEFHTPLVIAETYCIMIENAGFTLSEFGKMIAYTIK